MKKKATGQDKARAPLDVERTDAAEPSVTLTRGELEACLSWLRKQGGA